jgi:hypothetical protein
MVQNLWAGRDLNGWSLRKILEVRMDEGEKEGTF